ncbi:MAG: hypothetical protein A3J37_00675 [Alphaproteobacteria bacterium RIFCSPHIGHO2_12_FULL_45_9]|nr:MAG: hypothetical protein A3B66_09045 [Alphaproteobacteria bacterium RIFCSPHIGHO2_02_FULL_46_13]OFW97763.1 MAG: hypothetical protein A3J37_00675 [Alphaproteobacteria bacterium RIFCSPHIGHO2_12_FULL_45_9]
MFETIKSLVSPTYREKKRIERAAELAAEFIEATKTTLAGRGISRVEQLKFLEDNRNSLFNAFEVLSGASPIKAIQKLLELGEALQEKARPYFWNEVQTPIGKLLENLPEAAKKRVYLQLLKSAPTGTITDFVIDHAEDFVAMITSPKTTTNDNILDLLRKHTAPRTADFIEKIRPLFLEIYQQRSEKPDERLILAKKLLAACLSTKGNSLPKSSPNFIEDIRAEQIKSLVCKIGELYADEKGDKDFKGITRCLQELEALQACNSEFLTKTESERKDSAPAFFRLYQISPPPITGKDTDEDRPIYILTTKEKGRGNPMDGGKISIVLVSDTLERIRIAFPAVNNIPSSRNVVERLVQSYQRAASPAPSPENISIPDMSGSFELTAEPKGVDLGDESLSHPLNRDHVSVEQHQPTAF